jgi:hypothetical protein
LSATDPFTFAIVLKYTVNETMKIWELLTMEFLRLASTSSRYM